MRIICCAYRDWALKVVNGLTGLFPQHTFIVAKNPEDLAVVLGNGDKPDLVFAIGWSWIYDPAFVEQNWVVGVHPSDLPSYAGGSPIQNQILDGVTHTKNTLFKLAPKIDQGPVIAKMPICLDGDMTMIFDQLTCSSTVLFADFIRAYPDRVVLTPCLPTENCKAVRRLKPEHGRLVAQDFEKKSTRELYDHIRCREEPYPNAYIEDDKGILFFPHVEWKPKT